jgi:chitin deacetylase
MGCKSSWPLRTCGMTDPQLTFDDGVGPASSKLYDFLEANNASTLATHFMIGGNILSNPTLMQRCATSGGHIAVHTWSHQYMTSMSNEDVLSELGWTMQIIADLNGGRIPRFWRPPFGDVDNRVRAIAKGVFGLETVVWNQGKSFFQIFALTSRANNQTLEIGLSAPTQTIPTNPYWPP